MAMSPSQRQELLSRWIQPSSANEQLQQDRARRMVFDAVNRHPAFHGVDIATYVKGSYRNNTNVRRDSDVDVVVECRDLFYYSGVTDHHRPGLYSGHWTPELWRQEVTAAMRTAFSPAGIDTSGTIAIRIKEVAGSRPSTDVVPSFEFHDYTGAGYDQGSCVFPRNTAAKVVNWPQQQLDNGIEKNNRTGRRYKNYVRALKNAENALSAKGVISDLPSYFMECLVFNVSDGVLCDGGLDEAFEATLLNMFGALNSGTAYTSWVEPNLKKWLFQGSDQKWSVEDGLQLVAATWSYLYGS
jgi:hypothetical protein